LECNAFITNRILREQIDLTYDQAIHFFQEMVKVDILVRVGTSSGTRYVLSRNVR
jgi:hypothetical protein